MAFFKFNPILKQTLWGGEKLVSMKKMNVALEKVGESWELSGVEGNETTVSEGEKKGLTLNELVGQMREGLLGRKNWERLGAEFPLLIKFIDAHQDLSIQVHPNDKTARRHGHPKGKTEMWYVMDSDEKAKMRVGLNKSITPEEYELLVRENRICEVIQEYAVREGDCFFLPSGRIHSIGAGCLIAEIQQTSDVTYRIYDFNRRDKDGKLRQLHTQQAAESIDYTVLKDYRTHYEQIQNCGVELVSCPYFHTSVYDLTSPMALDYRALDSFVVLIGVRGEGKLVDDDGNETLLRRGETVLIPATTKGVHVTTGELRFLQTYVL